MRGRLRTVTIGGVPRQLAARDAARFEVVRSVLAGTLRLDQGARRLRMTTDALARLVEGARQAVLRELGDEAFEQLQQNELA
jgi:hypothetical protein